MRRRSNRAKEQHYARQHGYFWLPCPLCGDEFGGHEYAGSVPTTEPGIWDGICVQCTIERQQAAERALVQGGSGNVSCARPDGRMVRHTFPFTLAKT